MAEPVIEANVSPSEAATGAEETSFLWSLFGDPVNATLVIIIMLLSYKILKHYTEGSRSVAPAPEPQLPKMRRDFNLQDLKQFDGNQPDGRILIAVNGSVYDVTKGKRFYGPGGPYGVFGGRDASRGLATFSVEASDKDEYDDLSDLSAVEMDSVREWEAQFKEKYEYVGRLLKPGEQPHNYSEDEEETPKQPTEKSEGEKKEQ